MTWQNCERLAKHCLEMGDEAGANMYQERADRKKQKFGIVSEKPKEEKSDGKKSKG